MNTIDTAIDTAVIHVLSYFDKYTYPPTEKEIGLFLNCKVNNTDLHHSLEMLVAKKNIFLNSERYALRRKAFGIFQENEKRSIKIIQAFQKYLLFFKCIPTIRFIGISGSLSMLDNDEEDDLDIFIITRGEAIWITRFIILSLKHILMILPLNLPHLFCFNIYFDERDMVIKKHRRSEYVAHEVLQLKPIINKCEIYQNFLLQNNWIIEFFPNVQINSGKAKVDKRIMKTRSIIRFIDYILEKIQKKWLDRKRISYCQENGQLWLIQEGI